MFLSACLVLGRDVHDAVRADVERDLNRRHASRRRRDAAQFELAALLVVRRNLALALEDADRNRGLVVLGRREGLALLGRYIRVAVNEPCKYASQRLDAE